MSSIKLSIEDDDPWIIAQSIFDILCEVIEQPASVSLEEPANRLNALYPDNRQQGDDEKESPESFLLEMWDVVLKVILQLEPGSTEQERLVLLLNTLRGIKPEKMLDIWGSQVALWKSLPLLGSALTEHFHSKNT